MIEVPYVGGPYDGQIGLYEHLGTTWSRSAVRDEDGNILGYYHCDGPGATEIRWISIEERHEEVRRIEAFVMRLSGRDVV